MKNIYGWILALTLSIKAFAETDIVPSTHELKIPKNFEASIKAIETEKKNREKAHESLVQKRAALSGLVLVAIPDHHGMPSREEVLPYRFSDVSGLLNMLRDPEWSSYWKEIAITIGMAADKNAALELIDYIVNFRAEGMLSGRASDARLQAITALGYTMIDQEVPEAFAFLEKLTDPANAASLDFKPHVVGRVPINAYLGLVASGTDDAIALLERRQSQMRKEKSNLSVKTLSVGATPASEREQELSSDIELFDEYIKYIYDRRAGLK